MTMTTSSDNVRSFPGGGAAALLPGGTPIRELSIDIETYSSVDLTKCGVYKYAESPDFEVTLFGYAVNGGAVQVVDLLQGDEIPEHVLRALTDDSVTWLKGKGIKKGATAEEIITWVKELGLQ